MTTESIRVHLFKSSFRPFTDLLNENNIDFVERRPAPGVIMNAGEIVEILNALQIPSIVASLATVICAFLKARASRKVYIATKDNKTYCFEGYGAKEIEEIQRIFPDIKSITAIDTKSE